MRKLIVTENMSLDGVISPLGEWFDPSAFDDEELIAVNRQQRSQSDALVLGRTTFEEFQSYWPTAADEGGVSDYLNAVAKYVITSRGDLPVWANTTVLEGDPVAALGDLKRQEGRDITVTGSVTLVHALLDGGIVDEVRVFVYPAVQGEGRRLFAHGPVRHLRPVGGRVLPSGVVYSAYAVAEEGDQTSTSARS